MFADLMLVVDSCFSEAKLDTRFSILDDEFQKVQMSLSIEYPASSIMEQWHREPGTAKPEAEAGDQ